MEHISVNGKFLISISQSIVNQLQQVVVTMKSLSFIIVIFIAFSEPTFGWRKFWKGRRFDGNVGPPTDYRSSFYSDRDENLWFTQKLDHFEPTNDQIWKQV